MRNVVEISRNQSKLKLTLNRPDRLNGFTSELAEVLLDQIVSASDDDSVRVIILTGAGRIFSTGMDLDDMLRNGISEANVGGILDELYNPLVLAMANCPKPIVCGLNGVAAGGAVSLVLGCDIIVARRSARLISAFSRIGLTPDCGGSWFYVHAFGLYRAKAFAMLEDEFTAEEAHALGVIAKLADDDEFDQVLEDTALHLANASPQAMRMIKRSFNAAVTNNLPDQLELERALQDEAARAPDFEEGVAAFRDKRKPIFGAGPK